MAVIAPKTDAVDDSPVIKRLDRPLSQVARRDHPWGVWLGAAGVACLALIVFSSLSQGRQAHAQPVTGRQLVGALAPVMPAVAEVTLPAMAAPAMMPTTSAVGPAPDPTVRWKAPAMVVDIGEESAPSTPLSDPAGASRSLRPASPASAEPSDRFDAAALSMTADTVRATRLRDTTLIAPQGTVIPAVMETAINLDLPGFARAVVSRDVRGFDGATVLIPRGSRLIGQYRAGVAAGQSRAFVVWSRVLTPDGVSIDIASPGADRLGRSGVEGETNTHFFRRFGNSILLSVLSAGLEAAAASGGNGTAIIIGSQQQATNIATIALQKEINIPDTVTVAQGTPIRVFIARDLDFSGVVQKTR